MYRLRRPILVKKLSAFYPLVFPCLIATGFGGKAVYTKDFPLAIALGLVLLLGLFFMTTLGGALQRIVDGDELAVEAEWGGFGGGVGGWRLSRSLLNLLAALLVGLGLTFAPTFLRQSDILLTSSAKGEQAAKAESTDQNKEGVANKRGENPDTKADHRKMEVILSAYSFLAGASLACIILFVDFFKQEAFAFRSSRIGFGEGSGGWRISRPLSVLLIAVLFILFMLNAY